MNHEILLDEKKLKALLLKNRNVKKYYLDGFSGDRFFKHVSYYIIKTQCRIKIVMLN